MHAFTRFKIVICAIGETTPQRLTSCIRSNHGMTENLCLENRSMTAQLTASSLTAKLRFPASFQRRARNSFIANCAKLKPTLKWPPEAELCMQIEVEVDVDDVEDPKDEEQDTFFKGLPGLLGRSSWARSGPWRRTRNQPAAHSSQRQRR